MNKAEYLSLCKIAYFVTVFCVTVQTLYIFSSNNLQVENIMHIQVVIFRKDLILYPLHYINTIFKGNYSLKLRIFIYYFKISFKESFE